MVEKASANPPAETAEPAAPPPRTSKTKALLGHFLTVKWLGILLGLSIVGHAIGFAFCQLQQKAPPEKPSPEISLGDFRFQAGGGETGRVAVAEFSLHIALLDGVDHTARHRLCDRRFRVQQDIEQLLRQAHGGDFEDPGLAELKRQLQEKVDQTLGVRAIAEVIITNVRLKQADKATTKDEGRLTKAE